MFSRLLLLCFPVFVTIVGQQCPPGTTASGDRQRCFHFMPFKADFLLAEQICKQFGGNLAAISNNRDNKNIFVMLKNHRGSELNISQVWIGGSKMPDYGEWKWRNGEALTFAESFVKISEISVGVNCLSMTADQRGGVLWTATKCCTQQAFVCETKAPQEKPICPVCPSAASKANATVAPISIPEALCKPGWSYFNKTARCYRAFANNSNNLCNADGGVRVSIHSAEENEFVASLAKALSPTRRVLLGAFRNIFDFAWLHGSPFDYTNWYPNDVVDDSDEGSDQSRRLVDIHWNAVILMTLEDNSQLWNVSIEFPINKYKNVTFVCKNPNEKRANSCANGWTEFEGFRYCAIPKQTWLRGQDICRDESAQLASVHSAEENDFVSTLVAAAGFNEKTWLGGTWPLSEGGKVDWLDESSGEFMNGAQYGEKEYNHGAVNMGQHGEWNNDVEKSAELTVVCKKPA